MRTLPPSTSAPGATATRSTGASFRPRGPPQPLRFLDDIADLDWVISANLLSQLARTAANGNEGRVMVDHLSALARLRCTATLIRRRVPYRRPYRYAPRRSGLDVRPPDAQSRPQLKWEVA